MLHDRVGTVGTERCLLVAEVRNGLNIVEAKVFGPGKEAELLAALASHGVGRLVRIMPAKETICRTAEVPAGIQSEMDGAAALLAEASLPEGIPAHRRAGGLVPGARDSEKRVVLLTAWRTGEEPEQVGWADQCWIAPIAALAFLTGGRSPAAYSPANENAVCIYAPGSEKAIARVLVTSPVADRTSEVARALAETCEAANIGDFPLTRPARELSLVERSVAELASTVRGANIDSAWLERFGLALGALLAYTSPSGSARSLAAMHPDAPETRTPWPERAAAWLAHPRHALYVGAAAIGLLLLGPLVFAGARLAVLNVKASGMPEKERSAADVQKRAALYREH